MQQAKSITQKLSTEQEKHLADWVLAQAALGLPPTHQELRFLPNEFFKPPERQKALENVGVIRAEHKSITDGHSNPGRNLRLERPIQWERLREEGPIKAE